MRVPTVLAVLFSSVVLGGVAVNGCSNASEDCQLNASCPEDGTCNEGDAWWPSCCDEEVFQNRADTDCPPPGVGGSAGDGGGGSGAGGNTGGGGSAPCGGACSGDTPLCDETSMECVACLGDGDCDDPAAAKCDAGSCVACDDSAQCAGITGTEVCEAGACVECNVDDVSACDDTCDLLAFECVDVAAGSVGNCEACSNDDQCETDFRCIAMDFDSSAHGHYCLEVAAGCTRPYGVVLTNKTSLNGDSAANYCGIAEDNATCEAVNAHVAGWVCSGTDGMCSPDGIEPDSSVPGALCRDYAGGGLTNQCTYACDGATECPTAANQNSCGEGDESPPGWCGG